MVVVLVNLVDRELLGRPTYYMNVKKQHLRKVKKLPSSSGHRFQVEMVIDDEQYKKLQAGNPFRDLEVGAEWEEG